MNELPEILNTKQTCKALGISRVTLWQWVREGRITPIPQETARRKPPLQFRREDVEQLLRQSHHSQE